AKFPFGLEGPRCRTAYGPRRLTIMNFRQSLWAVLAQSLLLAAPPAGATDSHTFARDEYAIIGGGLAPNRTVSLAAHADGEGGGDNFHIWLMAEPGHRKLEALDGISSDNNLDTGPKAYFAQWSNDSRRVAGSFVPTPI